MTSAMQSMLPKSKPASWTPTVTIEEGYVERLNGTSPPRLVEPLLSEEYQAYYRQVYVS